LINQSRIWHFLGIAFTLLSHEDSSDRPDFFIGTDNFHTPIEAIKEIKLYLEGLWFTVAINSTLSSTKRAFTTPAQE